MPSTKSRQAINCASVGQRPSQTKEYSSAKTVSLTISCPHRLALRRRLAMLQKIVASQVEPSPVATPSQLVQSVALTSGWRLSQAELSKAKKSS